MDYVAKAHELLNQTEAELRRLLGEAAAVGDYDAVLTLTALARAIHESEPVNTKPARRTSSARRSRDADINPFGDASPRNDLIATSSASAPDDYPKFARDGTELVRIGLSRVTGEPYERRVDRAGVEAVASRIDQLGLQFHFDSIGTVRRADDTDISADQIKVCVSWFHSYGLIYQHEGNSYSREGATPLADQIDITWELLPER